MKFIFAPLALALLLNLAPTDQTFKAEARGIKREVRIYLGAGENLECEDGVYCIAPVLRTVDRRAPARGALQAFLSGPTTEEKSHGFYALHTQYLSITRLAITKGTARVSFRTTREEWQRWPGDLAPIRFAIAIEKTLKQFPNVRRVIICLDGDLDFVGGRGGPRKRCN